jgi:hypothetical protein
MPLEGMPFVTVPAGGSPLTQSYLTNRDPSVCDPEQAFSREKDCMGPLVPTMGQQATHEDPPGSRGMRRGSTYRGNRMSARSPLLLYDLNLPIGKDLVGHPRGVVSESVEERQELGSRQRECKTCVRQIECVEKVESGRADYWSSPGIARRPSEPMSVRTRGSWHNFQDGHGSGALLEDRSHSAAPPTK